MSQTGDENNESQESSETPAQPSSGLIERQQRLNVLRQLANDQNVTKNQEPIASAADAIGSSFLNRSRGPFLLNQQQARRIALASVTFVVIISILITMISYWRTGQHHANQPKSLGPIVITPISDSMACPTDMSWSLDKRMLAVVGYDDTCPTRDPSYGTTFANLVSKMYQGPLGPIGSANDSGRLIIYNPARGNRVTEFAPNATIVRQIHSQGLITKSLTNWLGSVGLSPDQYLIVNYTYVLWALDQKQLILTFTCYIPDGPPIPTAAGRVLPGHIAQGVLRVDVAGQHAQAMLQVGGSHAAGANIWDLASGQVVATLPLSTSFALQPPALSYSWDKSALVPHAILSPTEAPTAPPDLFPVGLPSYGSSSFTIWQAGVISTAISSRELNPPLEGVGVFATSIAALSPDGRYLATTLGIAGLLPTPSGSGASSTELANYGWQAAPLIPLRDSGLNQALSLAKQSGFPGVGDSLTQTAVVGWSPNGREIAVIANTPHHAIELYDCATGKQLRELTPPALPENNAKPNTSLLAWSSDGGQLAYYDASGGTLTLWNSTQLSGH